jgi:hypothetical protein
MGALALHTTFFHSCFLDIWSGEQVYDMSSSSFIGIWGHKSGHAKGDNQTVALFREFSQTNVKLVGGDAARHGVMTYDKDGNPVTMSVADQQKWVDSVGDGNRLVPLEFELTPITTMIDDPVKLANMNATIAEYVGEVKQEMEDLVKTITPIDPWKTPKWCHWVPHFSGAYDRAHPRE